MGETVPESGRANAKNGSFPWRAALDHNAAAGAFRQPAADVEPEPDAWDHDLRICDPIEAIEDQLPLALGNANSCVLDYANYSSCA